jgi:hypothetical protein
MYSFSSLNSTDHSSDDLSLKKTFCNKSYFPIIMSGFPSEEAMD